MKQLPRVIALLMVLAGAARMAATYKVFSPTYDEMLHLVTGLEWWQAHDYTLALEQPPLSKIAQAAGPYFAGSRRSAMLDPAYQGWAALEMIGVKRGLTLARAGNLIFFVVLCATVWWWTRRLSGEWAAALAVLLVSCLPPLLGHGALATTDLALAATLPLALCAVWSWWRRRTIGSAVAAGMAVALMIASKYSAFLFFPSALAGLLLVEWRGGLRPARQVRQWVAAASAAAVVLLAVFHFRFKPISETGWALPLVQVATGIRQVAAHSAAGHDSYLFGEYRTMGWWYFFPVVFAVKTPIAFLALLLLIRRKEATPAAAAAGVILSAMPSTIDIGIRHILPVYPLLAVAAASAGWRWIEAKGWRAAAAVLLLAAIAGASIAAAPDYLAEFNLLAGTTPERVRVDSDLDWGQDLFRLAERCRERNITSLNIAPFGLTDLELAGLPYAKTVNPREPVSGWFAISVTERTIRNLTIQGYRWLDGYQPVERVGKTIDLFYIRNPQWPDPAAAFDHPVNYGLADFPSGAPVAHIAPLLQGTLLASDLRTRSVYGFEEDDTHGFCWLSHGAPGFRATLWARAAVKAALRVEAAAGPMRLDNVRHLQCFVNSIAGPEQRFDGGARLSWPLELRAGTNVIELRTPDVPQRQRLASGETRELIVRIDRINIEPRDP